MQFKRNRLVFQFSVPDLALAGMLLCSGQGEIYLIAVGSALLHEAGHLMIMRRFGAEPQQVLLSPLGAQIQPEKGHITSYREDLLTAAGGPLVNGILCFSCILLSIFYETPVLLHGAAINFFMGLTNLFPAKPLDGERIFRSLRWVRESEKSGFLCEKAAFCSVLAIELLFAIAAAYRGINWTIILFGAYVIFHLIKDYDTC